MATGAQWEKEFKKLSDIDLMRVQSALTDISDIEDIWPFFKQEYGPQGLNSLKWMARSESQRRETEPAKYGSHFTKGKGFHNHPIEHSLNARKRRM